MIKNLVKGFGRILLWCAAGILMLLEFSYVNHKIQLKKEAAVYQPIGQQVEVNGHSMNVYKAGKGDITLVFLSGGGICSPVLDFKSLDSLLCSKYAIAVVEKVGYGFSEDAETDRDIDAVLSETRQALSLAGLPAPYVLCPHSMSGIEALYWAQQYPQEVSAIIGLDMSVPEAYRSVAVDEPLLRLAAFAVNIGLTRWIPGLAQGDAVRHGTLTEEEKALYQAIFYRRSATRAMIREALEIKASAECVARGAKPEAPVLLFSSNGSGGTGFDQDTWRAFHQDFLKDIPKTRLILLDCPHSVHNYEYLSIAEKIHAFLLEYLN